VVVLPKPPALLQILQYSFPLADLQEFARKRHIRPEGVESGRATGLTGQQQMLLGCLGVASQNGETT